MKPGYIHRLLDVVELLIQQPRTVGELAEVTGYKRDTIYGYMLQLVQHGVAYVHEVRPSPPNGGHQVNVYWVKIKVAHGASVQPAHGDEVRG